MNHKSPTTKQQLRETFIAKRHTMPPDERAVEDAHLAQLLFERPEWHRVQLVLTYLSFGDEVCTWQIVQRAWVEGKQVAAPRCGKNRQMSWYLIDESPSGTRRNENRGFNQNNMLDGLIQHGEPDGEGELVEQNEPFGLGELVEHGGPVEHSGPVELGEPIGHSEPHDLGSQHEHIGQGRPNGLIKSPFGMFEPDPAVCNSIDFAVFNADGMLAIVPALAFDRQGYRLGYGGGFYDRFLSEFPGTSVGLCRSNMLLDSLAAQGAIESYDLPVDEVIVAQ